MDAHDHKHCSTCIKQNCPDLNVCKMVYCPAGCLFRMHQCKTDDHMFVCSKEIVPCSNADYGCPLKIQRDRMGKHLAVCPASVLFCTMEWNRYPLYSKSRLSWVPFFQPNPVLVKGQLDVELALRDQKVLEDVFRRRLRKGKAKVDILRRNDYPASSLGAENDNEKNYRQMDSQNGMAIALALLENQIRPTRCKTESRRKSYNLDEGVLRAKEQAMEIKSNNQKQGVWSQNTADPCENGTCISSSHLGHSVKQRGVDTFSNPRGSEEGSKSCIPENEKSSQTHENIQFCMETNQGCFQSCDIDKNRPDDLLSVCNQNEILRKDEENQSEEVFLSPPKFAEIYLQEPLGLNVMLETLPKFQKQLPMYSIPCNQVLRRNEYGSHFKNVHSEIHGGLNGWLEHRCPLAQYGCTFVHHRLLPGNQCSRVVFNQDLGSFGIRPCMKESQNSTEGCLHQIYNKTETDFLCSLPIEILEKIAQMLDGFSLCNFSRVSRMLREVSQRIVERKGMVTLEWEKRIYDDGLWSWQIRQKKWFFSTSFSSIDNWIHSNTPGMAAHMEKCHFFKHYISHRKQFCYHAEENEENSNDYANTLTPFKPEDRRNMHILTLL